MHPNNGIIYAVVDTRADDIHGGLILQKNDAAAIRLFGDIASNPQTVVHRHPDDFELRRLGYIDTANDIQTEGVAVIITGAQWAAAQQLGKDGES